MTKFLLSLFILGALYSFVSGQKCNDKSVGVDRRICSHMVVKIPGMTTSQLKGIVINANEEGIPESIIEIYEAKEDGKLIATYKTGFDGRFCFKNLPKGKYLLKVGWSRLGYNCTDIEIKIKGNTKRFIKIPLEIGT